MDILTISMDEDYTVSPSSHRHIHTLGGNCLHASTFSVPIWEAIRHYSNGLFGNMKLTRKTLFIFPFSQTLHMAAGLNFVIFLLIYRTCSSAGNDLMKYISVK